MDVLTSIQFPLWLVLALIFFTVLVVLASVEAGFRMSRRENPINEIIRAAERQERAKPTDMGDYINDSVLTPESIRRDREGRRVFDTTKEG